MKVCIRKNYSFAYYEKKVIKRAISCCILNYSNEVLQVSCVVAAVSLFVFVFCCLSFFPFIQISHINEYGWLGNAENS